MDIIGVAPHQHTLNNNPTVPTISNLSMNSTQLMQGPVSPRFTANSSQVSFEDSAVSNTSLLTIQGMINSALDRQYDRIKRMFTEKLDAAVKDLRDDLANVESDVAGLQSETKSLSERVTYCEDNVVRIVDICSEVRDREQRSKNVILHGFSEHGSTDNDLLTVNQLLEKFPGKPKAKSAHRLSKLVNDKTRPLKLFFESRDIPMLLFKHSQIFEAEKLKATNDSTPLERELLQNARTSLQKRTEKGEHNLTIKFIRGNPTVVKQKPKNA